MPLTVPGKFSRRMSSYILPGSLTQSLERLQAIPSEWSEWVLRLDRTYVTIENGLVDYIDIATTRARTFYNVAILVFCCHALPATRSQPTASTLEKFLRDTPSPEPEFKRKIDHALQMFLQIASDVKYGQIAFKSPNKKVAPVEFVFIGTSEMFSLIPCRVANSNIISFLSYTSFVNIQPYKASFSISLTVMITTTTPAQDILPVSAAHYAIAIKISE